ncbi:DUF1642 domain-containing protein [Listeria marthii]|uniref:DUF1642 domain-containing protein n=1 Tax=Listeria marthii TaxID=529731 RepID=UPI001625667E|nr:DUF1642 domain-containing protein [Listeria marthii]MBC2012327.1 DUF1642 domain-containing protein [Listeria marthii]
MKKITQEYVEGVKDHNGLTVIKAPVVSEAVANWFEENKGELEFKILTYIKHWDYQEKDEFYFFMSNDHNESIATLIKMHYGYYVQKEVSK